MKYILPIFFLSISFFGRSQTDEIAKKGPFLQFLQTIMDYDTIERYSNGTRSFTFYNTGDEPLVITKVKSGCSCTVPSYTKDTIFPGERGEIKARFNTKKAVSFNQELKVYSNSSSSKMTIITIKGVVIDSKKVWGIEPKQ